MLKARILTSLVLIPLFLAALFYLPEMYWALLMLVIITIGAWEWASMNRLGGRGWVYPAVTFAVGVLAVAVTDTSYVFIQQHLLFWGLLASAIFWTFFVPIWLSGRFRIRNLVGVAVIGWVILIPTWLAFVSLHRIKPELLLALLVAVWIADSAAYFAGKRFGRHKLAPKISPGKTWEGVLGAWLAVSVYGLVLCSTLGITPWIILGLWGITVLSIMGDLLESLVKRHAEVKDSGRLLPGHGGVLDRIDGLTSSLPLAAFFIYFPLYFHYAYPLWASVSQ